VLEVSHALWSGDRKRLGQLAGQYGSEANGSVAPILNANYGELRKAGHYMGGMLSYAGEWYWGIDRLRYLEAALARYRDLLQKATEPLQVLAVERELERVRSDLDRIKGRLTFLRDRVARATIAIALHSPEAPHDQLPFAKKPQISSGVRALSFVDVRESGTSGYLGSGLTLRLPSSGGESWRGFILDVDVMRACCKSRPDRSDWAYDILLGFDLYSEALQSGRRRWLNPYLGARVGFSQTQDRGDFAAAGVFGLEIFKTSALMIDVQARAVALVGNPDGPHAAIQPSIGFDLGF